MFKWLKGRRSHEQKTWVYCPGCKKDLCSNDSFVKDDEYVYYKCTNCGEESKWNFDIAPVAIRVDEKQSKDTKY